MMYKPFVLEQVFPMEHLVTSEPFAMLRLESVQEGDSYFRNCELCGSPNSLSSTWVGSYWLVACKNDACPIKSFLDFVYSAKIRKVRKGIATRLPKRFTDQNRIVSALWLIKTFPPHPVPQLGLNQTFILDKNDWVTHVVTSLHWNDDEGWLIGYNRIEFPGRPYSSIITMLNFLRRASVCI